MALSAPRKLGIFFCLSLHCGCPSDSVQPLYPLHLLPIPKPFHFSNLDSTVGYLYKNLSFPHADLAIGIHEHLLPTASMLPRRARSTLQCLNKSRQFSSTPAVAAVTPHRKAVQALNSKTTTEPSKRTQSTATATSDRATPSPAFNINDGRRNEVHALRPYRAPEMDHSFIGMTGGEIFHEMMLRQGVKHVCMQSHTSRPNVTQTLTVYHQLDTQEELFSPSSTQYTTHPISTSFYRGMSKAPATWPKAMRVQLDCPALFL
jgi:hypothetical protein